MPLILPSRYGDRVEEDVASATHSVPSRVVQAQTELRQRGINVYRCPLCLKEFRYDDEFEPMCTGPNETSDDHPMTVMELVRVDERMKLIL